MLVILQASPKRGKHLDGLPAALLLFHSRRRTKMVNKKMLQTQFLLVSTLFMFFSLLNQRLSIVRIPANEPNELIRH